MKVYISGAITGIKNNNKAAFAGAYNQIADLKRRLHLPGLKIVNPIHIGMRINKKFSAAGNEPDWSDYMRACIKKLCEATHVYFLDDWATSNGASLERHIAKRLGIPCADNIDELRNLLALPGTEED
jgi:hypothetical protein